MSCLLCRHRNDNTRGGLAPLLPKGGVGLRYHVIADFINQHTGKLVRAGDTIEANDSWVILLRRAHVIGEAVIENVEAETKNTAGDGARKPKRNQRAATN